MIIYLIGFMGSGKTTVGQQLAKALNRPFYDLDMLIEAGENLTVTQIFDTFGADYFRQLEQEYLMKTADFPASVVATGGGTPCFFNNMDWMNQNGLTVFLDVLKTDIWKRLERERANRPLLSNKKDDEVQEFIEDLLTYRRPFYEKAKIKIIEHTDVQSVINKIITSLE